MNPLVSVIIPTYNRANFLGKAIRSVLDQSYQEWELIIWVDGSTDNSIEIIKNFTDKRIRYFADKNHGKSYALNQAFTKSNGTLIAFLDDDDQWTNDKLIKQIDVLAKHPEIDILFGNFDNISLESGKEDLGFRQNQAGLEKIIKKEIEPGIYRIENKLLESLLITNFIAFDSVILKKEIITSGEILNENLRNGHDLEFWSRLVLKGFCFGYLDKILLYRIKPSGSLSSPSVETFKNLISSLELSKISAIKYKRNDLLPYFKLAFHRAWNGLLREYALQGNRREAVNAFYHSLKNKFSIRLIYLFIGAMTGPKIISLVRTLQKD
jgi:glycosyltransferase involved in cell wall biosynthesis